MNEGNLIIQSVKRGSTGEQQCIIPQIKNENARQKGKTQQIQTTLGYKVNGTLFL